MPRWMFFLAVSFLVFTAAAAQSQAHFIWIDEIKNGEQQEVHLFFGEAAAADNAELIDKVAHSKAWVRTAAGEPIALELTKQVRGASGSLASSPTAATASLTKTNHSAEAFCDYGVISRGDTFLLQYYAKHLAIDSPEQLEKLGRASKLPFDIVPRVVGDGLDLQVFFGTEPAAGAELVVVGDGDDRHELTADDQGRAHLAVKPGDVCAVRAAWFEKDKSGERDGKKYDQVRHYSTLTLRVPANQPAITANNAATNEPDKELPAAELLARARAARAVWENFHGFSAELAVHVGDQSAQGHMEVDENGTATIDMADSPLKEWAEAQLSSLVQHRMPSNDLDEHVAYADQQKDHPLGRKINLGETRFNSVYRIKDDVVTEVNRDAGKVKFTISVLEIFRNIDNKYLPRTFTISTWDAASGELRSSLAGVNEWTRVGKCDLPIKILEVTTAKGTREVKQMILSNLKLIDAPPAQASK